MWLTILFAQNLGPSFVPRKTKFFKKLKLKQDEVKNVVELKKRTNALYSDEVLLSFELYDHLFSVAGTNTSVFGN